MGRARACCCRPAVVTGETRLLGVFFLLKATLAPMHMLPAFLWGMPPPHLLQTVPSELPAPTIGLDRDVAVKTLAGRFLPRPMGL